MVDAERELARVKHGDAGQLRIAVECHNCFDWLMPALDEFRQHWSLVELDIVSGFHTCLLYTSEAFAVSDEVIVMNKGKIMQKAPAKELYLRPNSLFLANFMGESSIFEGKLENGTIDVNGYKLPLSNAAQFNLPDGECLVGVRPEAIYLKAEGEAAQQCEIKSAVYMGNHWEVVAIWAGKELLINTKPEDFNADLKQAYVNFSEQGIFLLKKEK